MVGSGSRARTLFDLATQAAQVPRVILPVKQSALQVEVAEVPGFSTVLAKVDRIAGPDEHLLAMRVLQNAPVSELERSAVEEAAVEMVEGFSEMGVSCAGDDVVMQGLVVTLRPLCIWRLGSVHH